MDGLRRFSSDVNLSNLALQHHAVSPDVSDLVALIREITDWYSSGQHEGEGQELGARLLYMKSPAALAKSLFDVGKDVSLACWRCVELGGTSGELQDVSLALLDAFEQDAHRSMDAKRMQLLITAVPTDLLVSRLMSMAQSAHATQSNGFAAFYCCLLQYPEAYESAHTSLLRQLTPVASDALIQGCSLPIDGDYKALERLASTCTTSQWDKYVGISLRSISTEGIVACLFATIDNANLHGRAVDLMLKTVLAEKPLAIPAFANAVYKSDKDAGRMLWNTVCGPFIDRVGKFAIFAPDANGEFASDDLAIWQRTILFSRYSKGDICHILRNSELTGTKLTEAMILVSAILAQPEHMDSFLDCVEERCSRKELGMLLGFVVHPLHDCNTELEPQVIGAVLRQLSTSDEALSLFLQQIVSLRVESSGPDYVNPHLTQFFAQADERLVKVALLCLDGAIDRDHSGITQVVSALICSPHHALVQGPIIKTLARPLSSCAVAMGLQQAYNSNIGNMRAALGALLQSKELLDVELEALLQWATADVIREILVQCSDERWMAVSNWLIGQLGSSQSIHHQDEVAAELGIPGLGKLLGKRQLILVLDTMTAAQLEHVLTVKEFPEAAQKALLTLIVNSPNIEDADAKCALLVPPALPYEMDAASSEFVQGSLISMPGPHRAPPVNEAIRSFLEKWDISDDDLNRSKLNWDDVTSRFQGAFDEAALPLHSSSSAVHSFKQSLDDQLKRFFKEKHVTLTRASILRFLQGKNALVSSI